MTAIVDAASEGGILAWVNRWSDGDDPPASESIANAEFIIRACNAHDELLAACEAALQMPKLYPWIKSVKGRKNAARYRALIQAAVDQAKRSLICSPSSE